MRRHLLNLLTFLSLLACVGVVVVSVKSGTSPTERSFRRGAHWCGVYYDAEKVAVGYRRAHYPADSDGSTASWDWAGVVPPDGLWAKLGFGWGQVQLVRPVPLMAALPFVGRMFNASLPARYVQAPWWALVVLTGIGPAVWFATLWRRFRRRQPGCCASCGYDLRATPERCPECGAEPKSRDARAA